MAGVIIPNAASRVIDASLSTEVERFDVIKEARVLFYTMGRPEGTRNTQEEYITAQVLLGPGRSARLLIVGKELYLNVFKQYPATLRKNPLVDGFENENSTLGKVIKAWTGAPSYISGWIRPLNQNQFGLGAPGNRTVTQNRFMGGAARSRNANPTNEVTGWQLIATKTVAELQRDMEAAEAAVNELVSESVFVPGFAAQPGQVTAVRTAEPGQPSAPQPTTNTLESELLAAHEAEQLHQETEAAAE